MHGMRRAIVTFVFSMAALPLAGLAMLACSSSSSQTGTSSGGTGDGGTGGTDGGASADSATSTDAAEAADAAPVNGCKTFDDRTATGDSRTITWGFPLAAADRCIDINVGQSVTWSGNFAQYRVASSGGDSPNPIATFDPGVPTVKFPKAGTYGFESPDAPALVGAIRVNP